MKPGIETELEFNCFENQVSEIASKCKSTWLISVQISGKCGLRLPGLMWAKFKQLAIVEHLRTIFRVLRVQRGLIDELLDRNEAIRPKVQNEADKLHANTFGQHYMAGRKGSLGVGRANFSETYRVQSSRTGRASKDNKDNSQ